MGRLLPILVELKLLTCDPEGIFHLTAAALPLTTEAPDSIRHTLMFYANLFYPTWGDLHYSCTTGASAFEHRYGSAMYDYLKQNREQGAIFDRAMLELAAMANEKIMQNYDFSRFNCLVDVGGGGGHFLAALLRQYPKAQGILFDLPAVIERAAEQWQRDPLLASRCQWVGGSFFEQIPSGGDLYLIRNVLNDWGDEAAVEILRHCRMAMGQGGRLLLILRLYDPENASLGTHLLQLNRLLTRSAAGGTLRSLAQLTALCEAADLTIITPPLVVDPLTELVLIEVAANAQTNTLG